MLESLSSLSACALELLLFFLFFSFCRALAGPGLEKSFCDLFMWKSRLVPLATWKLRLILIPDALDRDVTHSVAGSFKSGTDIELGRRVGFFLFSPLKINISTHNPTLSQVPGACNKFILLLCK